VGPHLVSGWRAADELGGTRQKVRYQATRAMLRAKPNQLVISDNQLLVKTNANSPTKPPFTQHVPLLEIKLGYKRTRAEYR